MPVSRSGNLERAAIGKRVHFSHTFLAVINTICSCSRFADEESELVDGNGTWSRQGEAFWRAHHEAWKRSDFNQQQYCEAKGIPLKAFGNWRAIFKAEPQPPERKLLWRRRGLESSL